MTRDAKFKKVVRRHAGETGQRYTDALTDLEGLIPRVKSPSTVLRASAARSGLKSPAGLSIAASRKSWLRPTRCSAPLLTSSWIASSASTPTFANCWTRP
jgi:hypothetical protein